MKATVKLTWDQPGPFVLLEMNTQAEAIGVELVPELVSIKALSQNGWKVPISIQNITSHLITIGAHMFLGHVSVTTPLPPVEVARVDEYKQLKSEILPCSEALPPEWQKRIRLQLSRWEKIFSRDDFDVEYAKSAHHRIWLQEDKPFRERARRVPLSYLKDLREEIKVIRESRSPYASPIVVVRKKNGTLPTDVYRLPDVEKKDHP